MDLFTIVEVSNSSTALTVAEVESVDAIVLNSRLPGAWIACRLLAARFQGSIPLIVMTDAADAAGCIHARRAGATHVIALAQGAAVQAALAATLNSPGFAEKVSVQPTQFVAPR